MIEMEIQKKSVYVLKATKRKKQKKKYQVFKEQYWSKCTTSKGTTGKKIRQSSDIFLFFPLLKTYAIQCQN